MDYPHILYEELRPYCEPLGTGVYKHSLLALARSVLLSDETKEGLQPTAIAAKIAAKNTYLEAGIDARWEKTLRTVLRTHYCFIGHSRKGQRDLYYTCDASVDPKLKRHNGVKRGLSSETSTTLSASTSPGAAAKRSLPIAAGVHKGPTLASDDGDVMDIETGPSLEIESSEVSEVYERRIQGSGVVVYCQQCGPVVLKRQRATDRIYASPFLKLFRLLRGSFVNGRPLREVFEVERAEGGPPTISRELARTIAKKAQLPLPEDSILDDKYPTVPDEQPIRLKRSHQSKACPYCNELFNTRELKVHLAALEGTCQLAQPDYFKHYLSLLNERSDDGLLGIKSEAAEDGETSDNFARPIVSPTFTVWTAEETDRFFHALPRYSRFRPDAIAAAVRTKTESEVCAFINQLAEAAADLPMTDSLIRLETLPAAREMSSRWLTLERSLSQDAIVWEAFTQQAYRTPAQLRDRAQLKVTREIVSPPCAHCHLSQLLHDNAQPRCPTCDDNDAEAEETVAVVPESGQLAWRPARLELLQSLSWYHLLQLSRQQRPGSFQQRLEMLWWKAFSSQSLQQLATGENCGCTVPDSNDGGTPRQFSRTLIASVLGGNGTNMLIEDLEAIYQYLKGETRIADELPNVQDLLALPGLPEVISIKAQVKAAMVRGTARHARHNKSQSNKWAWDWSQIPLSYVEPSDRRKEPRNRDIYEEVQQAHAQLRAVRAWPSDLGKAADLFDLRNFGLILDLYRKGTEDVACIASATLQDLYELVRKHVARVLACALSIADNQSMGYTIKTPAARPDDLTKCIRKAVVLQHAQDISFRSNAPKIFQASIDNCDAAPSLQVVKRSDMEAGPSMSKPAADTSLTSAQDKHTEIFAVGAVHGGELDNWDDDVVSYYVSIDSGLSDKSESDSEMTEPGQLSIEEIAADRQLADSDAFEDHIYEQNLWDLLTSGKGIDSIADQEESAASTDNEGGSAEDDVGLSSSGLDSNSEDDDEQSGSASDASMAGQSDVDSGEIESENSTAQGVYDRGDPKRQRSLTARPVDPLSSAFRGSAQKEKVNNVYRTREFISTSDEEEENE